MANQFYRFQPLLNQVIRNPCQQQHFAVFFRCRQNHHRRTGLFLDAVDCGTKLLNRCRRHSSHNNRRLPDSLGLLEECARLREHVRAAPPAGCFHLLLQIFILFQQFSYTGRNLLGRRLKHLRQLIYNSTAAVQMLHQGPPCQTRNPSNTRRNTFFLKNRKTADQARPFYMRPSAKLLAEGLRQRFLGMGSNRNNSHLLPVFFAKQGRSADLFGLFQWKHRCINRMIFVNPHLHQFFNPTNFVLRQCLRPGKIKSEIIRTNQRALLVN